MGSKSILIFTYREDLVPLPLGREIHRHSLLCVTGYAYLSVTRALQGYPLYPLNTLHDDLHMRVS